MVEAGPVSGPATIPKENIRVLDQLNGVDQERTQEIVSLKIDGYSQGEIVELLAERSIRTGVGALYGWRPQCKPTR